MSYTLKIDSNNADVFLAELKQIMNIVEGSQIEIKKVDEGFLLKPISIKPKTIKSPLIGNFISGQEQRKLFETAANEMQSLNIPEDDESLDSDWWINILNKKTLTENNKIRDISFED